MENWKFALSSIWGHKLRSLLTMLGIIIGVSAVVIITRLGNAIKKKCYRLIFKQSKRSTTLF